MNDRRLWLWVGKFRSESVLARFLAESYSDRRPISEFAKSQGIRFYDHDQLEHRRLAEPTDNYRTLLAGLSFAPSFVEQVCRAQLGGLGPVDTAIILFDSPVAGPSRASGAGYELHYAGTFAYDPDAACDEGVVDSAGGPATVLLRLVTGGPVHLQGQRVDQIALGRSGLVIGRGASGGDLPYLDLAPAAGCEGVCAEQVRIRLDQFDQWILEDRGGNGKTVVGGTTLNHERSMPWHGIEVAVGAVVLRWERPA